MIKKEYKIIIILLIIIFIFAIAIINFSTIEKNTIPVKDISNDNHQIIANDTIGSVDVIRNIGNPNSSKKIAYVVGVHPLENQTHKTLLKMLPNVDNLNCCYDIYVINVTQDIGYYGDGSSDNSQGRQNGQNLALKYVCPEILNGNYDLAIDVHSNIGAYEYKTFVFSPVKESLSSNLAREVASTSPDISYYAPESTTSGPYLTIPLNEKGTPAFYFEEYSFAAQEVKDSHMLELIRSVDNLNL